MWVDACKGYCCCCYKFITQSIFRAGSFPFFSCVCCGIMMYRICPRDVNEKKKIQRLLKQLLMTYERLYDEDQVFLLEVKLEKEREGEGERRKGRKRGREKSASSRDPIITLCVCEIATLYSTGCGTCYIWATASCTGCGDQTSSGVSGLIQQVRRELELGPRLAVLVNP